MPEYHRDSQRKPTAKRSPSILVTDVRNQPSERAPAPFAGAAQNHKFAHRPSRSRSSGSKLTKPAPTKFSNISVSNILSNASEIPSALRRLPPHHLGHDGSSLPLYNFPGSPRPDFQTATATGRRTSVGSSLANRRGSKTAQDRAPLPNLIQPLPPRTSKTSQKLVYIPDDSNDYDDDSSKTDDREDRGTDGYDDQRVVHLDKFVKKTLPQKTDTIPAAAAQPAYPPAYQRGVSGHNALLKKPVFQNKKSYRKAKAEIKKFNKSKDDLARVTAYFISDAVDLEKAAKFLRKVHKISPRIYDEALYVPYQLPLLDGSNGYRVRSNFYSRNAVGKANVDDIIDKSEQRDYHFEYYSGQENEELLKNNDTAENTSIETSEAVATHLNNNINSASNGTVYNDNGLESDNTATEYDLQKSKDAGDNNYASDFKNNDQDSFDPYEPQYFNYKEPSTPAAETVSISQINHAEVFLFNYGVIVFWNFTKSQEENILADLSFSRYSDEDEDDILLGEINEQDIETEEFHFEYDKSTNIPRIYNDMITLKSEDHIIKMTISHAVAQSTKLCRFESRMSEILYSVSKLPKILALTGQLGLNREQLLRKSGKLFKLRVDVNLSSNVLDTPEFFWSFEPSLNPLYTASRDYLEIDERVEVINDRCKVFLEFTDVIADSIAESNMNKITWIIIVIIVISVCVSCLEIFIRYKLLNKDRS